MKKLLLMAIVATTMMACSKKDDDVVTSKDRNLAVSINFPALTRAIEAAATATWVPDDATNVTFELCNYDEVLDTKTYTIAQIKAVKGTQTPLIHNIPNATNKLKVYINKADQTTTTSINTLQGDGGSVYGLDKVIYFGEGDVTKVQPNAFDPNDKNELWQANVNLNIQLSRFEVKGHDGTNPINITVGATPKNISNGTLIEVQSYFSAPQIAAGESSAREAWKAANGPITNEDNGKWTYEYSVTFSNTGYFSSLTAQAVYVNNFNLYSTGTKQFNDNEQGSGNWNAAATANYGGAHSKMWNTLTGFDATKNVAGFNLYPQKASTNTTDAVKTDMPHIVVKLKPGDESFRWITIRAFNANGNLVNEFKASEAYTMSLSDIQLDGFYKKTLVVTAKYDGGSPEDGEEIPDEEDPTDPDPEHNPVGKDLLIVNISVKKWTPVAVTPVW